MNISFMFLFVVSLCLISLCNAGCGTFTAPSGNVYQLDGLTTDDYQGNESNYNYLFNFCTNTQKICGTPAPVVQISSTQSCTPIGLLPAQITEISAGDIKINYTTGDYGNYCGPYRFSRVSSFFITCDLSTNFTLTSIVESSLCKYVFSARSKYACVASVVTTASSTTSYSTSSVSTSSISTTSVSTTGSTTSSPPSGCGYFTGPSGNVYDLSGLTSNTGYKENSEPYTYEFNFCQNVVSNCSLPTPVAQISNQKCISNGYLPASITETNSGIMIEYVNRVDSVCTMAPYRSSRFNITCDPSTPYYFTSVVESTKCQYVFQLRSKFACPISTSTTSVSTTSVSTTGATTSAPYGCGYYNGDSGAYYNLSPLSSSTDYVGYETNVAYKYVFNFCQNTMTPVCKTSTPVAQISLSGTCMSVGYLPAVITEIPGGINIKYINNVDICGNPKTIPRVSSFHLVCDPSVEFTLLNITETSVCQYLFNARTKYSCPIPDPYPTTGAGSL